MNSILVTIRKALGVEDNTDVFDTELIMGINTAFLSLNQLGVGPTTCYSITGIEDEWVDFFGTAIDLEAVKTYVQMKVRLFYDPPQTAAHLEAINRVISELEFRLNHQVEHPS